MPSEIKVSEEGKTLSWNERGTYVVMDFGHSHVPKLSKIEILTAEKGEWRKKEQNSPSGWSKVIQVQQGAGPQKNVLVALSTPVVYTYEQGKNKPKRHSIGGGPPDNSHVFGFDIVIQSPTTRFHLSSQDFGIPDLADASDYRDKIIQAYETNYLDGIKDGKQYKITSEDGAFYYEVSEESTVVDMIAVELKKVCESDLKQELETWLSDEQLWGRTLDQWQFGNEESTLSEIMTKLPKIDKSDATEEELNGDEFPRINRYLHGSTPETKFSLKSGGFFLVYTNETPRKLHWDEEQENWAVTITSSLTLKQEFEVSYIDKYSRSRQKVTCSVQISSKSNTRTVPLSLDNRDGVRPMLKEFAGLGMVSKLLATGPSGAKNIEYQCCFYFNMDDLGQQPEWLQGIVSLAPQAFHMPSNPPTKMKPLSRGEPSTTSSPLPLQHPRDIAPQNHMGPNSELNWHIVEALQRIAEAMERIADKNND